jgi:hypothetical protein
MKKSKKKEEIIGASLVDIPSNAKDRLEIVLEASGVGGSIVGRKKISIGLDDGGGALSLAEARKLSEVILEMSLPKFKREFGGHCFLYQVNLFMGNKQYMIIAPNGGGERDERLDSDNESILPF